MKTIIRSFTSFLVTAVLFTSCKKEKVEEDIINLRYSPEALSYLQLPTNRYFIYRDSATSALDSVVVTECQTVLQSVPKYTSTSFFSASHPAYTYQVYSLKLTKFTGMAQDDWFSASANSAPVSYFFVQTADSAYINLNSAFWHPFKNNPYDLNSMMFFLTEITIEGKRYESPVVFINNNGLVSSNPSYRRSVYYWVKGLGIIKREIQKGSSIKTELLVRNS